MSRNGSDTSACGCKLGAYFMESHVYKEDECLLAVTVISQLLRACKKRARSSCLAREKKQRLFRNRVNSERKIHAGIS